MNSNKDAQSDLAQLVGRHVDLARLELQLEIQEVGRRFRLFFMAALLFTVGFCFLQVAVFMGLIHVGVPTWAASILLGLGYIVFSVVLVVRIAKRRSSLGVPFEGTQQELERSLQWISKRFF